MACGGNASALARARRKGCLRLLLLGCLPNALVEPFHDVALLARAVVRVVIAGDLDRGVARLLGGVEQVTGRGDDVRAESLAEVLEGDPTRDARDSEQPMKDSSLKARLRADRPSQLGREDKLGERTPCSERFALHPRPVSSKLLTDLARKVDHADLVLLGPVEEPAFAELALDSDGPDFEIEVGPLYAETLAQPEPGSQRDEEEEVIPRRAASRCGKQGGLLRRQERVDALLLVHCLTEQLSEAQRGIREASHPALDDQPLIGLVDRSQEIPTRRLATLAASGIG